MGDLDDLPTTLTAEEIATFPGSPPQPDPAEVLAAAEVAVTGLHRLASRRCRRLARLGVQAKKPSRPDRRGLRLAWDAALDPMDAAAADVAARTDVAVELHRRLRDAGTVAGLTSPVTG